MPASPVNHVLSPFPLAPLQHDYTFDEVAAKSAAGAKLCRVIRTRPLVNVLASAGINSTRGLLLVTLVSLVS